MDRQDFIQAVEEMKTPASKALEWVNIINDKYYRHYNETNRKYHEQVRDLFHKVAEADQKLVDLIPQVQTELQTLETDSIRTSQIFTHVLAGPIAIIRDYTMLILSFPFWHPDSEQSEDEMEHIRYLHKINIAAAYLSSLDRDVVLKEMLDRLDE